MLLCCDTRTTTQLLSVVLWTELGKGWPLALCTTIWTINDQYLVVFITLQNLVGINTV